MQPKLLRPSSGNALAALITAIFFVADGTAWAASSYHYQLLDGSSLVDDCHVCGRPAIFANLRGGFDLVLKEENPLFATYSVTNIDFHAGLAPSPYEVSGYGTFRIGGEVALQQSWTLQLKVNGQTVIVTNESTLVRRWWPMVAVDLSQANDTNLQYFAFSLAAAPIREFWFSTESGFTPADFNKPRGSAGDILSSDGRVVVSNGALMAPFHLMPVVPETRVDALDVLPGGELAFSLDEDEFSGTIGTLQHGDVLGASGNVLHIKQALMHEFGLPPKAIDLGLDALHTRDDGEVLFSITTDVESPIVGMLHRGDLLSHQGVKVRTFDELLARFQSGKVEDHGLDAIYVWASGEIWFSLETGLPDSSVGGLQPGDLLSDQGYVVARNLDILAPFQPIEDLADFGLDGLFVITDFQASAEAPLFGLPRWNVGEESIALRWEGSGRVFQLERSPEILGPWDNASQIIAGQEFQVPKADGTAFFRLKQW